MGRHRPFQHGHPHSHVAVRGTDDAGKDLIIAQDYVTDGVRLRAQERATLELGAETGLELRRKLQAEVSAERFTRIDRAMLQEAPDPILDLEPEVGQVRADCYRTLRIGRLQIVERLRLAAEAESCQKSWSRRCANWASAATSSRRSIAR